MKRNLLLLFFPVWLLAQQAAPELSISANGSRDLDLYAGWPLIVRGTVLHSLHLARYGDQPPLKIAPAGMAWVDAVQFNVTSDSGQGAAWNLNLVGAPPDPVLTLPNHSYVMATWQMSADAVSGLTPGTYRLTASLQIKGSDGWNGSVQSLPVTIRVGPEPTSLTPAQQARKAKLAAEYAFNMQDANGAISAVGQWLKQQPGSIAAMGSSAVLAESSGLTALAFFQASDALDAFVQQNPDAVEMPDSLLELYQRLLTEMAGAGQGAAGISVRPRR